MIDASRVLVAGDTHGNVGWWKFAIFPEAKKRNASCILQVGDFGLVRDYLKYLRKLSNFATNWDIPIYWIDGNHDKYNYLIQHEFFGADHPCEMAPGVTYLPRGFVWEWGGVSCMALGGGYSVDQGAPWREPGVGWFPEEEITYADMDRAIAQGHVKVMFTHDAPAGYFVPGVHAEWKQNEFPEADHNRQRLRTVFDRVHPEVLIHGHYHVRYSHRLNGAYIIGLDCDAPTKEDWGAYKEGSMGLLTLEDGDWEWEYVN